MRWHSATSGICSASSGSSAASRVRLDADDRGQRVAERPRVDLGAVAGDHAVPLEPLDALGNGGRGEADATAELRERDAPIGAQLAEDLTVDLIDQLTIIG